MTKSLDEIAKQLKDSDKKVNLIYAFNGTGKTRLSKAFKNLIAPKENHGNEEELTRRKILYFNAFTEDLFYWDNDLLNDTEPKLNKKNLNSIKIPIPSIPKQQRIVSILDKFETLTNSITEGLPLAIEQSQKRYEYYRELLLNFS